jgi:hypothetical protein
MRLVEYPNSLALWLQTLPCQVAIMGGIGDRVMLCDLDPAAQMVRLGLSPQRSGSVCVLPRENSLVDLNVRDDGKHHTQIVLLLVPGGGGGEDDVFPPGTSPASSHHSVWILSFRLSEPRPGFGTTHTGV